MPESTGQEPTPNTMPPQVDQPQNKTQDTAATVDVQEPTSIDQLPQWAQQQIRDLRDEAAKHRVKAKDIETSKADAIAAANADRDTLIQQIGKTLGLVQDEPDADALLKAAQDKADAANAERDKMAAQLATYRRQDAVRNALKDEKGNPIKVDDVLLNALLTQDNGFNALDLDAGDYNEQVSKHVADILTQHPQLRAQAAPTASGVDPTKTSTPTIKVYTREDLKTMSASEINRLVREGKLNHLMTKQ